MTPGNWELPQGRAAQRTEGSQQRRVQRFYPHAFCVRLADGSGYLVWPGKIQPRGFEQSAIGFGKTARSAWASVQIESLND